MSNWTITRTAEERTTPITGRLRCVLVNIEEAVSKSGNEMLVLYVRPSGCRFDVKTYIVKNEYYDRDMTRFHDAFQIPESSDNPLEWKGAEGAAVFDLDDNGYLKIKRWIYPAQAANLPPFEGDKPERQEVTSLEDEEDDGDLPFEL